MRRDDSRRMEGKTRLAQTHAHLVGRFFLRTHDCENPAETVFGYQAAHAAFIDKGGGHPTRGCHLAESPVGVVILLLFALPWAICLSLLILSHLQFHALIFLSPPPLLSMHSALRIGMNHSGEGGTYNDPE